MATCSSADSVLEAAQLIKANGTKLNTFVNGTEEQTVQLGTGDPTPTLRNMAANAVSIVAEAMSSSVVATVNANSSAITDINANCVRARGVYEEGTAIDIDNIAEPGAYSFTSIDSVQSLPIESNGTLIVFSATHAPYESRTVQIFCPHDDTKIYFRFKYYNWTEWESVVTTADMAVIGRGSETFSDLNDATAPGVYKITSFSDIDNMPTPKNGMLSVFSNSTQSDYEYCMQFYMSLDAADVWTRECFYGTWSDWRKTVNQSIAPLEAGQASVVGVVEPLVAFALNITRDCQFLVHSSGYYDTGSGLAEDASKETFSFVAGHEFQLYFDEAVTSREGYTSISLYSHGTRSRSTAKCRYRKMYPADGMGDLPTVSAPLSVAQGDLVSITVDTNAHIAVWSKYGYASASVAESAVRESIYKNVFSPVSTVTQSSANLTVYDGYYDNGSSLLANASYTTWEFSAQEDFAIWFDQNSLPTTYVSITPYAFSPTSSSTSLGRLRLSDGNLPTEASPLQIKKGYICRISANGSNFVALTSGCRYTFDRILSSDILLPDTESRQSKVKFSTASDTLEIYLPISGGWCRYDLAHLTSESNNYDIWRMSKAKLCDKNFAEIEEVTSAGEWECAIKLDGRPDFAGGSAHGDEVVTSTMLMADGKVVEPTNLTDAITFSKLVFVEASNLYDPDTGSVLSDAEADKTLFAKHYKEYIFSADGLTLSQRVAWQLSLPVDRAYLAMLPAAKAVTDHVYADVDLLPSEIEVNQETGYIVSKTWNDASRAVIYGSTSGVSITFEIIDYPQMSDGVTLNLFDNNGGNYNKLYFLVPQSGDIPANTVWTSKSVYSINATLEEEGE